MLDLTKFSYHITSDDKLIYSSSFQDKNLRLNIILGDGHSYPTDINVSFHSYIYVGVNISYINLKESYLRVEDFLNIVDSRDLEKLFGYFSPDVKVNNLQFTPNSVELIVNVLANFSTNSPQPCCKCGLMDHWNSKNNNNWYCYKHCSY